MADLTIFIPAPGKLENIRRGSAIVGGFLSFNQTKIGVCGPLEYPSLATFSDRVAAAGRALEQSKTTVRRDELIAVGVHDGQNVRTFSDRAAEALNEWLDIGLSREYTARASM